ncbi:heterokaryon incompatibility protein-domain-containing protein [Hypoxylon sp. FL1857]|nr:heterokaryon incompatibility protein-domain-containing protein [Hypoxylon sp. FL1857]
MNPTRPSADADLDQLMHNFQLSPAQLYANLPVRQNRAIRLLDLDSLPSESDTDETSLVGTLRVVSLWTKPRFAALSYVWGTLSTPHTDILELRHSGGQNVKLGISTNCRDALRALRRKYGALCIWVDAICIDQESNTEKGSQIPLMEEIFSRATVVYAWLGHSTDASDRVIDWTNQFAQHDFLNMASATRPPTWKYRMGYGVIALYLMVDYYACVIKDTILAWIMLLPTLGRMLCLRQTGYQDVFGRLTITGNILRRLNVFLPQDDICEFFNNEWFQRAWTFQELILAPKVVLICGRKHLEWTRVVTVFLMYATADGTIPPTKIFRDISLYIPLLPKRLPWDDSKHFTVPRQLLDLISVWIHTERPTEWNEQLGFRELKYFTYVSWIRGALQEMLTVFLIIPGIAFCTVSTFYFPWDTLVLCLRQDYKGSRKTYLAGVLQAIRTRRATDAKDRSYAAYGALQRLGIRELSNPDWSKPLGQVYQDLIRDLLQWDPMLIHLLIDAGYCSNIGSPSWVPDWSVAAERQWIRFDYVINPIEPVATPISEAWVEFRGNDELVVKGIQIDEVTFFSGKLQRIETSGDDPPSSTDIWTATLMLTRWLTYLIRDATNLEVYHPLSNTAAKILAADIDSETGLDLTGQDFFTWYKTLTGSELAVEERSGTGLEACGSSARYFEENVIAKVYGSHPQGDVAKDMTIRIWNHLVGRRSLFITANGLAGSGPEAMISSDLVTLIAGLPVPMIVRRVAYDNGETSDNLTFRIIGPAFVHGLMKGEGFGTNTEDITLV